MLNRMLLGMLVLFAGAIPAASADPAETVTVAVATNFVAPAQELAARFEQETGHTVRLSPGATGALYAQIRNGAPFDVLMAADLERPQRLEQEGDGVEGTRFTYAVGRLVLWSASRSIDDGPALLRGGDFHKLAIANPDLAPYGLAAVQTMRSLGVMDRLVSRLVRGANIGQAHTMVATGNAELGFVARSYLDSNHTGWLVPADLHQPIAQDAILLTRARGSEAARQFLDYLKSRSAREIIVRFGYDTGYDKPAP